MTAHHLRCGTPDLIGSFLDALSIPGMAKSWSLHPFRSPFYGRPEADHWDDRLPLAWRVAVVLSPPLTVARFPFDFAGAFTNASDSTAPAPVASGFVPPDHETCIVTVIGVFADASCDEVQRRIAAWHLPPGAAELWPLTANLTELRMAAGPLALPEQEHRLASLVGRCEDAGGICHWTMLAAYTER